MRFSSIFMPWRELAEANFIIREQRARLASQAMAVKTLREDYEDASARANETKVRLLNAEVEIKRLRQLLQGAVLRDPKTGRLLPKAKTPAEHRLTQ